MRIPLALAGLLAMSACDVLQLDAAAIATQAAGVVAVHDALGCLPAQGSASVVVASATVSVPFVMVAARAGWEVCP